MGNQVDLSQQPYDEANVTATCDRDGCAGVGSLFAANPITVGDCIEVGGQNYRIVAAKVNCGTGTVYEDGSVSDW